MKVFSIAASVVLCFLCASAQGQAVLPVYSYGDLVDEVDAVDDGLLNQSFTTADVLRLGWSMSLDSDSDTLVVGNGLRSNDSPNGHPGAWGDVITLRRTGNGFFGWEVESILRHPLGQYRDEYSYDVLVDGEYLFVTARRFDHHNYMWNPPLVLVPDTGAVFVYTRNLSDPNPVWTLKQTISNPDPFGGERFGHAIAFEGTTLVIAEQRAYDETVDEPTLANRCGIMGAFHIYEMAVSGSFVLEDTFLWTEVRDPLDLPSGSFPCSDVPPVPDFNAGRGNGFGKHLALDGDALLVSTEQLDEVAVFYKDEVDGWGFDSFLEQVSVGDWGTAVGIDQEYIVVGAKKEGIGNQGQISLFQFDPQEGWEHIYSVHIHDIEPSSSSAGFGRSVLLDGHLVAASCQGGSGAAEIYTFVIDPATEELVPQGKVYYNGAPGDPRNMGDKIGMVYDRESGMIIAGDVANLLGSGELRFFQACAADLNGDGVVDNGPSSVDRMIFQILYASVVPDPRIDFAAPYGVINPADEDAFERLLDLGCP